MRQVGQAGRAALTHVQAAVARDLTIYVEKFVDAETTLASQY